MSINEGTYVLSSSWKINLMGSNFISQLHIECSERADGVFQSRWFYVYSWISIIKRELMMVSCIFFCVRLCLFVCTTERALQTDRGLLSEPVPELGQMEYQLLKFFTLLWVWGGNADSNTITSTPANTWLTATHMLWMFRERCVNTGYFNQTQHRGSDL